MRNRRNKNKRSRLLPPLPCLEGNVVAIDTETTGLNPYDNGVHDKFGNASGARIFCWSYKTSKGEWGFMLKNPRNIRWLKRLMNDPTKHIVFQNAKFDLKMLSFEGLDVLSLKADIHCTMILSKVLDSVEKRHNLRFLARKHLGWTTEDKDEIEYWLKTNKRSFTKEHGRSPNFRDAPLSLVKDRVRWDTEATLEIFGVLYPRARRICNELYETERHLLFVCLDMESTGVLIDITRARELKAEAQITLDRIKADLDKLICPLTFEKKKKGEMIKVTVDEFNPGSSALQLPAAFEKLGIPLKYKTKPKKNHKTGGKTGGGNWAFDEYAMIRYVSEPLVDVIRDSGEEGWPGDKFYRAVRKTVRKHKLNKRELLPPLILKYRQLSKMISTYYDHFINDCLDVHFTPAGIEIGTIHCKFNQSTAMTGRFSSSEVNLQNQPRKLGPRECFITRNGRNHYHFDYDQIEMKMFVHFAEDTKMAEAIKDDIHAHVAAEVYNIPLEEVTSERRKRAKGVNFGIIYGSGPATMAETLTKKGLPTTVAQSTRLVLGYHKKFPSVQRTVRELKQDLKQKGYVTNPFGRRYRIKLKFAYKALNYMCQGTSADQMKKAMVDIWYWLRENNLKSKMILTVHDEIVLEVPPVEERLVLPKVKAIMEDLETYFVPMTVSVEKVAMNWSKKEKIKLAA